MNTSIRDGIQEEAMDAYFLSDGRAIINACPRIGKTYIGTNILMKGDYRRVLIAYPRHDIKREWEGAFKALNCKKEVTFCTFASLHKTYHGVWDFIIVDEPQELSDNQQLTLYNLSKDVKTLGLTGTLTGKTEHELLVNCELSVCYEYSINKGVEDGVLSDYQLIISKVPLDDKLLEYKTARNGKSYTEKAYFDLYQYIRKNAKQKYFMTLKLISIIQNSTSKKAETQRLLTKYAQERVLVFCGVTDIADSLGIPVYHSKSKEKEIFEGFCNGNGKHLATIKMMQAGITIRPINVGIINYMSGNPEQSAQKICRFLGLEYDNPDKKAVIHIVSSTEEFEVSRLKTGLAFFDKTKILNL